MRILGIETSTRVGSVGLVENGRAAGERSLSGRGHGETLAPLLRALLRERGWTVDSLDGVAVSIGPGSFTGLRVGLGLAKGIAFAAALPVIPVPTLDALATVARAEPGERVCPILDARRGELYAGCYRVESGGGNGGRLTRESGPLVVGIDELLDALAPTEGRRCRFLGDGVAVHEAQIEAKLGADAIVLPFSHYRPSGVAVALEGAAELPTCAAVDAAALGALEPSYVRPSYAEEGLKGRQRALRSKR